MYVCTCVCACRLMSWLRHVVAMATTDFSIAFPWKRMSHDVVRLKPLVPAPTWTCATICTSHSLFLPLSLCPPPPGEYSAVGGDISGADTAGLQPSHLHTTQVRPAHWKTLCYKRSVRDLSPHLLPLPLSSIFSSPSFPPSPMVMKCSHTLAHTAGQLCLARQCVSTWQQLMWCSLLSAGACDYYTY